MSLYDISSKYPRPRLEKDKLLISGDRVFFSVQGEGNCIGVPAVFLRLHFCNLTCNWCDTRYTWDESIEEYWREPQQWTYERAFEEVSRFDCKHLVVTGGEPLLQQKSLTEFFKQLLGWHIEIETNGTVLPNAALSETCWFNVSPKLSNSGVALEQRLRLETLKQFTKLERAYFKFVVSIPADLEEIDRIRAAVGISSERIIIMPEGTDSDVIASRMRELIPFAQERGWRVLPRLHVYLWGKQRMV